MQIRLLAIGKTDHSALQSLIEEYIKRLGFYVKFEMEILPDIKNSKNISEQIQKDKEGV
jgi:23S rRNA (pseudouridine1915-N3)-methyltransferase